MPPLGMTGRTLTLTYVARMLNRYSKEEKASREEDPTNKSPDEDRSQRRCTLIDRIAARVGQRVRSSFAFREFFFAATETQNGRDAWHRGRRLPIASASQISKRDLKRSIPTVTLLICVYSCMAAVPCSRPIPLSL